MAVRSKSELLVYEALRRAGFEPEYERPLTLGGATRYPDFTIADEISGRLIYWEHVGMLELEDYRRVSGQKLAWYRATGILPAAEGGGESSMLITSWESRLGGFDLGLVDEQIRNHLL